MDGEGIQLSELISGEGWISDCFTSAYEAWLKYQD
jgi:hypothetical protein